jgi:hypothetical protein
MSNRWLARGAVLFFLSFSAVARAQNATPQTQPQIPAGMVLVAAG